MTRVRDGGGQRKSQEDADSDTGRLKLVTLTQESRSLQPVLVSNMANALLSVGMIIMENETR